MHFPWLCVPFIVSLHTGNYGVMEKKRQALRKLLEAVEHELLRRPNAKTLDRLALLAGFQDWESFQETLHGEAGGDVNFKLDEQPQDKKREASR